MSENEQQRFQSYKEFWPFYLKEHTHPWNRRIHVFATLMGTFLGIYFLIAEKFGFIPICIAAVYILVWCSHFFIEKNKPATWKYPLWSLLSDFRMAFLFLMKKL